MNDPFTKEELLDELRSLHEQSTAFWESFPTAEFFVSLGEAWSPADNVRHLLKSNRPVARALGTARVALALRFGVGFRESRSYAEIRETYRTALAGGVTAGRFAPRPEPAPADPETARRALMEQREATASALASALARWGEGALDRLRLPHPALGKLTTREMLFFTLYHNLHHVLNVARRTGRG
ncbi:MAG TPA: DinB family protein [Thermoanaerobaculia bacterium]|nr:DinB family protein [Thermoanaerobaculia bacterium]